MNELNDFIHGLCPSTDLPASVYDDMSIAELEVILGIKTASDIAFQGQANNGDDTPRDWPRATMGVDSAGRRATAEEMSRQNDLSFPQHVSPSEAGTRLKSAIKSSGLLKQAFEPGRILGGGMLHSASGPSARQGWAKALAQHPAQHSVAQGGESLRSILKRQAAESSARPQSGARLFEAVKRASGFMPGRMRPDALAKHLAELKSKSTAVKGLAQAGSGVRQIPNVDPRLAAQKARYLARTSGGAASSMSGII